MSFSAKPDGPRPPRRRSPANGQPSPRYGSAPRAGRKPQADGRRPQSPAAIAEVVGARIIYLSWADTFGRPPRAWWPGMTARVLPFRPRQAAADRA